MSDGRLSDQLSHLFAAQRFDEAITAARAVLVSDPNSLHAVQIIARSYAALGKNDGAAKYLAQSLAAQPSNATLHNNVGIALAEIQQFDEAAARFKRAIALDAEFAEAHSNLGYVLNACGRYGEAADACSRAIALVPNYGEAFNNLGIALAQLGHRKEAYDAYASAVRIAPNNAHAHNNLGNLLRNAAQYEQALEAYGRAVAVAPAFLTARSNLANVLIELGRHDDAIAALTQVLALSPSNANARAQRLYEYAQTCDWESIEADKHIPELGVSTSWVEPFVLLSLDDDPARHRARSENYVREKIRRAPAATPPRPAQKPARLRIGYFSPDFCNHPIGYLIAGALEAHDREHFEVHAFSYGARPDDATRERIWQGVDAFHDIRLLNDQDATALACDKRLDIAIDLAGHTRFSRISLFADRIAPIQATYLGYPGTTGAPFMDYMIADRTVVPSEARAYYAESLIFLPHTYQANDDWRQIPESTLTRASYGLPEQAFVFACFNNTYKITREEFSIWMRLLQQKPGSVLWLLKTNKSATQRLTSEAVRLGVSADRIVFADFASHSDHLARHRLADLFLDTFNYNAHTTANDALRAGLPVVTKAGRGFASRVAASLLHAIDLPDLVTTTKAEYFDTANALANDGEKLALLRQKLHAHSATRPLFDNQLLTRHLERGYRQAYARYFDGLEPADILIDAEKR